MPKANVTLKMALSLLFLLPAVAAAMVAGHHDSANLAARGCTGDNCVRAVRAVSFPGRDGAGDCSTNLRVTVTPATSTSTVTVTPSSLLGAFSTVFTTKDVTATATVSTTAVTTETDVSVISVYTTTDYVTTIITPYPGLKKRQETASGSTYPAYASACSSFAKYSSACSCIGVTAETTTLPTPVTVVTVTASGEGPTTPTTSLIITTVSTVTLESTVSTATIQDETTTTVTVTGAAATATLVEEGPFILQVSGGNGQTDGLYVIPFEYYQGSIAITFGEEPTSAIQFAYAPGTNELVAIGYLGQPLDAYVSSDSFVIVGEGTFDVLVPLVCSVNSDNTVSCTEGDGSTTYNSFENCGTLLTIYDPDVTNGCTTSIDPDIILNIVAAP